MSTTLAILLYPGLALALLLGVLFGWLIERRTPPAPRASALRGLAGPAALAGIGLTGLALTLLPWPLHPAAGWSAIGSPATLWALFEGAFLLPLLPGFVSGRPFAARAAAREAQIGAAGRCVFWLAAGSALWSGAGWSLALLPGRLLLGLAGLLALPVAIGSGPFGAEQSLAAAGAEEGLDDSTAALVRLARLVRGAALLAALPLALLRPLLGPEARLAPALALAIVAALFVAVALLLRQVGALMPRLTLPGALRWCWGRALPLALAGVLYLALVRG